MIIFASYGFAGIAAPTQTDKDGRFNVQCWQAGVKIIEEVGLAPGPGLIGPGLSFRPPTEASDAGRPLIVVSGETTCLYRFAPK